MHTPFPWDIIGDDMEPVIANTSSTHPGSCDEVRQVCFVAQGEYEIPDYDEARSNAALIVAIPEMIDLLAQTLPFLLGYARLMGGDGALTRAAIVQFLESHQITA